MTDPAPWLVTGASGFLGRHLLSQIEALPARHRTLALVRDPREWDSMEWTRDLTRVETVPGTVTGTEAWSGDPRLREVGGIFHLAALVRHSRRGADEVVRTNVEGTLQMVRLAAARGCRMVFVSTSGTVGCFRQPDRYAEEESPYAEAEVAGWPYYRSKIEAEQQARRLADRLGVTLVILRPPVLLGPGDHRFRSTGHITRFLSGKLPFLVRGGMHFADVRDAAAALIHAMGKDPVRPVYHLPGTAMSIREFFTQVADAAGRSGPPRPAPYPVAWLLARLMAPLRVLPDPVVIEMAAHYWGLRSRYVEADLAYRSRPARDTIRDTVAWLRSHHPALAP